MKKERLALTLLSALLVGVLFYHSRLFPSVVHFVRVEKASAGSPSSAFTVTVNHYLGSGSEAYLAGREIFAVRSDGSDVRRSISYQQPVDPAVRARMKESDLGRYEEVDLRDLARGVYVHAWPDVQGMSTFKMTPSAVIARRALVGKMPCLNDSDSVKVVGFEPIKGITAVKQINRIGEVTWALPAYRCIPVQHSKTGRDVVELQSVKDGEPDPGLFQVTGEEFKPSILHQRWRAHLNLSASIQEINKDLRDDDRYNQANGYKK